MKRTILLVIISLIVSVCKGQEWFTNFDIAKRLALVQNKMLFVIWEDSFDDTILFLANSDSKDISFIQLSKDTSLDSIIRVYFVPVKLSESKYVDFMHDARARGAKYKNKLADNSIKIMDFNGNILNVNDSYEKIIDLSFLIHSYALNTSYLKSELENYSKEKRFSTAYRLAVKYIDFAIFANEMIRPEIIELANIYLDESKKFLLEKNSESNENYFQSIKLLQIKELLILNQDKKAYRQIKRIDTGQIDAINEPLYGFLNYTIYKLLHDEMNADLWKNKISLLDLKKAELILKNNMNGSSN